MLRTIASRNEWILRNSVSKASRSAARVLSTQVARTVPLIRWAPLTLNNTLSNTNRIYYADSFGELMIVIAYSNAVLRL